MHIYIYINTDTYIYIQDLTNTLKFLNLGTIIHFCFIYTHLHTQALPLARSGRPLVLWGHTRHTLIHVFVQNLTPTFSHVDMYTHIHTITYTHIQSFM